MKKWKINEIRTTAPNNLKKKKTQNKFLALQLDIFNLQHLFYATHSQSLLIIFQGIDAAGKDGVIGKVFNCVNPLGVHANSFKVPCNIELEHDYMWRIFQKLPEKGMIQIFNRSYYEDIIVPTIQKSLPKSKVDKRYDFINAFEEHLEENGTAIIKFYLHISPEEQKKRIEERLKDPLKMWKYSNEDKQSSERWNDYMVVYENILNRCNKVPWAVIPSDDKWYRDYRVASVIKEKLTSMRLRLPVRNTVLQNNKST
jgi:PPK2 family polyphosphate:nucleotide phosphotransferase